jgi:hypothetical protein
MEEKNKKPRKADIMVESNYRRFLNRLKLISKVQIKLWQALTVVIFTAGFTAAMIWSVSTDKMEPMQAAGNVSNTATVSYQDEAGNSYTGQSNTLTIPIVD